MRTLGRQLKIRKELIKPAGELSWTCPSSRKGNSAGADCDHCLLAQRPRKPPVQKREILSVGLIRIRSTEHI